MSEKQAPASTAYTRTLQLEAWIAGTEFPPHEVFLKALDVVAGGSLVESPGRRQATLAQAHADRLQAAANRVRESAERVQASAELAQYRADRSRDQAERSDLGADPSAGKVRQVKPKDSAPAANREPREEKRQDGKKKRS